MKRCKLLLLSIFFSISVSAAVFIKTDKGQYVRQVFDGKNSTNSILEKLGYETNMWYSYGYSTDKKSDIYLVCFKIFTSDIICVFTTDYVLDVREQDVKIFLSDFDFSFEYGAWDRESDMTEGINKKNLSIKFLSGILEIPYNKNSTDTMLVCDKFKYNLYFKDGYLCKFESSDGYNQHAKEVMESSPKYFRNMKLLAREYWGDDEESIKNELNIQCEAWHNLDVKFLKNKEEYLDKFLLKYDCYNFKIISVLYQHDKLSLREFKDICHGDVQFMSVENIKGQDTYIYKYKNAIFAFSKDGTLMAALPNL